MTVYILTKTGRGLIAAPMIDTATILIARRRRTIAVWAESAFKISALPPDPVRGTFFRRCAI
jgi:hypothetical protein